MMATFDERAWAATSDLRRRIIELPFNRELASGTLARERFQFYIVQDGLYLAQYARVLSIAAAKAPDAEAMEQFARSAQGAIVVERQLHGRFLETFGVDVETAALATPSPTCLAYTNFLLAVAHQESYAALLAAVLPCFSIYWEVGNRIQAEAAPDNVYQPWIDTYSDPAFGEAVDAVIGLTNRAAGATTAAERDLMVDRFQRSTVYEWMFWDSAYRLEAWPVGL